MKLNINKQELWNIALSIAHFIKRLYLILAIACLAITILSMSLTYPEAGLALMVPLLFLSVTKLIEFRINRTTCKASNTKSKKEKKVKTVN